MSNLEKKLNMAFALGYLESEDTPGKVIRYDLGQLDPEWDKYEVVGYNHKKDMNDTITLRYNGQFGVESTYVEVVTVSYGFENLASIVRILLTAIYEHKKI